MKRVTDQTNEILIVGDIDDNVRLLASILSSEGFSVCIASNERKAIQDARSKLPVVVMLDIAIPGIDGFEICRNLKANKSTQSLPVIFISPMSDENSEIKGFESGGVDFITKPFKKEEVLACVRSHISTSELISSKKRQVHRLKYASEQLEQETMRRKKIEEKLKEAEERFENLVRLSPVAMCLCQINESGQLIVRNSNPAADRILSTNYNNFIGKPLLEAFPELIYSSIPDILIQVAIGELGTQTFDIKYRNGRVNVIFEVTVFGIGTNSIAVNFLDVTQRRMSNQNDHILLRTLIDNLPVAVYIKDKGCRKIIANLTDIENIGLEFESQVIGKTDLELFDGEIGSRGYADDLRVIQSGLPIINREEMFINRNGKVRWMVTSKMPLIDESGKITGLVGIGRDITERKKEKELINKLTKSIEQSPVSVAITDIRGKIEYVNSQFCRVTGYSTEEVLGKMPRILKLGKTPDHVYNQLWNNLNSANVWRGEFFNKKRNGELYWEWVVITPLKDENGQITNFIIIHEDISQRKQMEADLISAKEKAEESDRLKSAFLANMSHEIRTPLNSIIGFSDLLADPFFDSDQKNNFINHIINNGNSLLTIISDIMEISKMESGKIVMRNSSIDVDNFLSEIEKQYVIIAKEKDIEFIVEIPEKEEHSTISVYTDKVRLRQIFDNLIGNALKFTMTGYIRTGYKLSGDTIEFFIKDTGIGIPKEFHSVVFDRFRQVDTSLSRRFGGTGLGLTITKNLIELMKGKIWFESEPGDGSTFYFSLPVDC